MRRSITQRPLKRTIRNSAMGSPEGKLREGNFGRETRGEEFRRGAGKNSGWKLGKENPERNLWPRSNRFITTYL